MLTATSLKPADSKVDKLPPFHNEVAAVPVLTRLMDLPTAKTVVRGNEDEETAIRTAIISGAAMTHGRA